MKLREYQHPAVESVFKYFENGGTGNPLIAMPTGTGKAIILGAFIKEAYLRYPNQRFIKLTHVKELIKQNHDRLLELWPTAPVGIYSAGLGRRDTIFPITYAGIASAYKNPHYFGHLDLIIIDEAHLVSPKEGTMYQKFIRKIREVNPLVKVIGLTATDYRLGQGKLTEDDGIFTHVVFDMTGVEGFNWFISQGYLSPLIPRKTHTELNVEDVKVIGGDYVQKELQMAVDQESITNEILKETIWLGKDRKHWLVFASGIEHAEHVSDMLDSMGVESTFIHSKMSAETRDKNLADYKAGKYQAMVNNGILTTGFDFPEIDLIVMLRPTQSPGLWVQMLGRGTRPVYADGYSLETADGRLAAIKAGPKQNCLVLDFAGNTRRLGPINDPQIPKRKGKGGGGEAPVKVCPECGIYNHAAIRFCFNCGAEFPKEVKIWTGASTEELLRDSIPQVETFQVHKVVYTEHHKKDKPPSIKVSYYCGLRLFEEWVCLEHLGYAKHRAHDWWRLMTTKPEEPVPISTEEGLLRINELKIPKTLRIWVNKINPQVMGHGF